LPLIAYLGLTGALELTSLRDAEWRAPGGPPRGDEAPSSEAPVAGGLTSRAARSILHHMVNYSSARLDRTFAALVDPTRRAILARLERRGGASISELARPFKIKLPAVMKHLDVLDEAGLITRSKTGRTVTVRLSAQPMRAAWEWLRRYERFWSASLDRLTAYAEAAEIEARKAGR
jgi:DNA-binding transcriptional ArsR family regulator